MYSILHRNILIILLTFCFTIPSLGQINVNGDLSDWNENQFIYDKENSLYYAVKNDQENLYVAIRKNEKADKVSVSKAIGGVQLYIDKTAKRDSTDALNIGYPVGDSEITWDQIRINNVGSLKQPKIHSVFNEFGIFAAAEHQMKGQELIKYQVEYKIPREYISVNKNGKISICILLKGFRWKAKDRASNGLGLDFSTITDLTERESVIDKSDWSFNWFDYLLK